MATATTEFPHVSPAMLFRLGASIHRFSDSQLYELCQLNRDLQIEREPDGDIIIMPPSGGESGHRNAELIVQLGNWNKRINSGIAFDSSTGFLLPNGAMRSPDAAWVEREQWNSLTRTQRKKFPPLAPDFVVELRSETDTLTTLRAKMREYIECGVRLAWLIDPIERRVEVYRPGKRVQTVKEPSTLSAEPELAGFSLDLGLIWSSE